MHCWGRVKWFSAVSVPFGARRRCLSSHGPRKHAVHAGSCSVSNLNGLIWGADENGTKLVAAITTTFLHAQGIFVACYPMHECM